ncbi:YkvA family protein [Maritalea sp. S77]|uniref:YkvA family protein n=1 Tax=Maritalea sp. S77 TaxID=3415125 RepID=UPI003C7EA073
MNLIVQRLVRFRREIVTLWHAFWHPLTPTYLKALTILTALYVISPIDLVADFIPVLGWIDDFVIVSFAVSWIVSRLPRATTQTQTHQYDEPLSDDDKTIDGTARRR